MKTGPFARSAFWTFLCLLVIGCAHYDILPNRDPCGGALTDSEACLYDYDGKGIWYVLLVRRDGLLSVTHRHAPGTHLFVTPEGDLLFHSRCSGRGEVIEVTGSTLNLAKGTVLLCDASGDVPRTVQLPLPAPSCNPANVADVARALYETSCDARVARFLSAEARLRLAAEWQAAKKRNQRAREPNSRNSKDTSTEGAGTGGR